MNKSATGIDTIKLSEIDMPQHWMDIMNLYKIPLDSQVYVLRINGDIKHLSLDQYKAAYDSSQNKPTINVMKRGISCGCGHRWREGQSVNEEHLQYSINESPEKAGIEAIVRYLERGNGNGLQKA